MIKVNITQEMIEKAKARDHGAYNSMSFQKGAGNVIGFLGEYMVEAVCPYLTLVDEYDHDFECNGTTIDVKTKQQNVPYEPKGYYEASVTVESLQFQHPDYYIFCRVHKDLKYGWVLGAISYDQLMKIGKRMVKGQDEGNMVFKSDSINVQYDQLTQLKYWIK